MVSELRIFTINRGSMEAFLGAWFRGVYPLRLRHGYAIQGPWVIPERNEFLWIVSYDGPESWEAKERAYYASAERVAMDPDPRQYIAKYEHHFLTPVSPPEQGTVSASDAPRSA